MERFEVTLGIRDAGYVDQLVVALVRQGYDVYYNPGETTLDSPFGVVCFSVDDTNLTKVGK